MSLQDTGQGEGGDNNIQVFVRIRPPCGDEPAYQRVVDVDPSGTQIILKQDPTPRLFAFDYVADIDSKQEVIFSNLGKKVIENCVAGYNGTIFAYGQTGSGKTFTMLGPSEDIENFQHELRGVIPRSFEYLYSLINREKELHGENKQFLCKCSFLEIYNEQIFDLMEPSSTSLHLRESLKTGVYVSGLSEKVVLDANEAYQCLNSSWVNRRVASTSMNRESSRSHAVFVLQIESKERKGAVERIRTSQLNLVDLAGSERQKDTGACGIRLKEAGSINKSLSNLGNVIMSLVSMSRDGNKRYIPYRDSKLTFLLRDSLGGNSKTSLIACVHPGAKYFGESLSTLQFAKRAKMIKNKAILNENAMGNIQALQAEIRSLKEELQKFKMGAVPSQPCIVAAAPENMPLLKKMFLQAMQLRMKVEDEKRDLKKAIEEYQKELKKKDVAIQSKNMIIKFREENIKRLSSKTTGEKIDVEKEELLKELELLRPQVCQHPQVAQHALEVQYLKNKIRRLEEGGALDAELKDSEKIRLLEEEYNRLIEQPGSLAEKQVTPQRTDVVSTATLEKFRSQISELESKNEQLKRDNSEQKQAAEKKEMYMLNEINSLKKLNQELETTLSATKLRTNMEKAVMDEMHLQTVLTITTPKKESYRLRNRTVITKQTTPDLDQSIPFESPEAMAEEEGILSETVPDAMEQQAQEALLDQIKHLKELKRGLESRINEFETEQVKLVNQTEMLTNQLTSLEELYDKEKAKSKQLYEELSNTEPQLKKLMQEKNNAEGECRDLKLMIDQADREKKEYKEKLTMLKIEKDETVAVIESKVAELQTQLEHIAKENKQLSEDKDNLKAQIDDDRIILDFNQANFCRLEKEISANEKVIQQLEQDLQTAQKTIADEHNLKETLVKQLNSEKDKVVLEKLDENKKLSDENCALKNVLEHTHSNVMVLEKSIEERDSKITHLENCLKGTEEKAGQYIKQLDEQNMVMNDLQQQVERLEEEMDFMRDSHEKLTEKVKAQETEIKTLEETLTSEQQKYEVQREMHDLDCKTFQEEKEDLQKEFEEQEQLRHRAEIEKTGLLAEVDRLKELLQEKKQVAWDLDNSRYELEQLTQKLNDLEAVRLDRTKENAELKAKVQSLEIMKEITDSQMIELRDQLREAKEEKSKLDEKNSILSDELWDTTNRCAKAELILGQKDAEIKTVQSHLQRLQFDMDELTREKEDLLEQEKRLKMVAEKDSNKRQKAEEELQLMRTHLKDIAEMYDFSENWDTVDLCKMISSEKEELEQLRCENSSMVSHHNIQQRIKYHQKKKDENVELKNKVAKLESENRRLQDENTRLKIQEGKGKAAMDRVMKENVPPTQKTYSSGDFTHRSGVTNTKPSVEIKKEIVEIKTEKKEIVEIKTEKKEIVEIKTEKD